MIDSAIVRDFTSGANYTLMPIVNAADGKNVQTGVSICVESAYPEIARTFTHEGADVLINITNDSYLGRTAVLRQHLANAVFRAVENRRPFLNITNTGISAYINEDGKISDETASYETTVRTWAIKTINDAAEHLTFYTRYGDVFAFDRAAAFFYAWIRFSNSCSACYSQFYQSVTGEHTWYKIRVGAK